MLLATKVFVDFRAEHPAVPCTHLAWLNMKLLTSGMRDHNCLSTRLNCLAPSIDAASPHLSFLCPSRARFSMLVCFSPSSCVCVSRENQDLRERIKAAGGMKPRSFSQELREHEIKRVMKVRSFSCSLYLKWCAEKHSLLRHWSNRTSLQSEH